MGGDSHPPAAAAAFPARAPGPAAPRGAAAPQGEPRAGGGAAARPGRAGRGGGAGGLRAGTPQPPHKPPFVLLRVPLLPLARGPRSLPRYPLSLPSPEWMYGCTCLFIDTLSPPSPPPTRTCPPPRRASERASEGPLHVIAAATFLHSPNSGPAPGTSAAPPPHRDRARRRGEAHNFS